MTTNAKSATRYWNRPAPRVGRVSDHSRQLPLNESSLRRDNGRLLLEAAGWVGLAAFFEVFSQYELFFAVFALVRLVTLRAEGGVAFFFGGQCLVIVLNQALETDLPVMAVTSLLPPIIVMFERKAGILPRAAALCLAFTPFLAMMYLSNAGLTTELEDRLLLLIAHIFGFSFLLAYQAKHRLSLDRLILAFLICCIGAAVYFLHAGAGLFSRAGVGAACHEIGRNAGICSLVFLICWALTATPLLRLIFGAISVCSLGVAAAPLSRQGLYMVPLSFVYLLYASKHLRTKIWKSSIDGIVLLLLGTTVLVVAGSDLMTWVQQPNIARLGELEDDSRIERLQIAWEMFLSKPLVGHGYGSFDDETGLEYPHNLFAEVLCEFGVLGLAALCIPGLFARRHLFHGRLSADGDETVVIRGILVFWLLVSCVSYSLNHSAISFLFLPWLLQPARRRRSRELADLR